jgi:hypothetical protein
MAKTKKQWQALCDEHKVKYTTDDTVIYLAKSLASALDVKFAEKDSVYKLDGKIQTALSAPPPEEVPAATPQPIAEAIAQAEPQETGDPLERSLAHYLSYNPTNIIGERQLMSMGVSTYNINMPNVNLRAGKYLVTRDRNKYHMFQINEVHG